MNPNLEELGSTNDHGVAAAICQLVANTTADIALQEVPAHVVALLRQSTKHGADLDVYAETMSQLMPYFDTPAWERCFILQAKQLTNLITLDESLHLASIILKLAKQARSHDDHNFILSALATMLKR